ncbi:cardiolipin synthase [Helcobacillus massiliensis]|uniref:Cardiolipin synthase n=1 Tax=Helcobacillus massiliensis TaxID=521392 RepID=A0A839QVT8_9MICO|nr:cardiolipin synthase [Helcobacillus massiliensis]MCG7426141.1 cardiolipin synthase [Helcobacillus sp. ACRRO]MBB3023748.1 cardiolipin synthase [Helcobacillus massiliensis]MCT1557726.1 cardiolipin synthase [Helcobacillus massiliensis]MCT2035998.1 cardiolipin synthase [Helcobacillus massiliensis]MCT2331732.1 cardiolipin synthase [Helcobacillus massiliensis]
MNELIAAVKPAVTWLIDALPVILLIIDAALRVTALIVVPRNRRPGSAMAWLMTIMVFPMLGFPLFLLLGRAQLPRKRRAKQKILNRLARARAEDIPDAHIDPEQPSWLQSAVDLNRELGAFPLTSGNDADLEIDYEESIRRMTADIDRAEDTVHVLFYIMVLDHVTEDFIAALARARARGVRVRALYDFWGTVTHFTHYRRMKRFFRDHDIENYSMMPIRPFRDGALQRPDLRNHRKLVVVDGRIGWMGSQNMIARHYNKRGNIRRGLKWQETMVRFRGPIVAEINILFATDWFYEASEQITEAELMPPGGIDDECGTYECQVVPSGPGYVAENNLMLFNHLFYNAERKIVAVSPYFVPDETMLQALIVAARRGVEIELFVSEIGDQFLVFHAQRSYYSALLEAGVTIWMYRKPYILHAKHVSVDESVAVIGSSNMDIRSFSLQMESSMMVGDNGFLTKLRAVEDEYRQNSRQLTVEEWESRSWAVKVIDNICRLASAVV